MSKPWQRQLASILVVSLAVILLVHFIPFWFGIRLLIFEDNKIILGIETVGAIAILIFGCYRFWITARQGMTTQEREAFLDDLPWPPTGSDD